MAFIVFPATLSGCINLHVHGNVFLDKINYSINQSYLFFDGKYGNGMMAISGMDGIWKYFHFLKLKIPLEF